MMALQPNIQQESPNYRISISSNSVSTVKKSAINLSTVQLIRNILKE